MMRGTVEWMIDLTDPKKELLVFRLLDYCEQATSQFIRLMTETGVHMISNGDSPAGPDMISPAMYRKFAAPYEKRIADLTHELGLPYLLHICGDTTGILDDLAGLGLDALELDFKTDAQKIHDTCGNLVTVSGILDPTYVFAHGKPEFVTEKTRELISIYHDSPRLILCSGCAVPPHTPSENVKAFVKAAREESY
jgi:MtaA/CmuA family methyltransferase